MNIDAGSAAWVQAFAADRSVWVSGAALFVSVIIAWLAISGPTRDQIMRRLDEELGEQALVANAARTGRRALVTVLFARQFAERAQNLSLQSRHWSRARDHKRRMRFRREAISHFLDQPLIRTALVSWLYEADRLVAEADDAFIVVQDTLETWRRLVDFLELTEPMESRRRSIRSLLAAEQAEAEAQVAALLAELHRLQGWGWLWPFSGRAVARRSAQQRFGLGRQTSS